MERDHTHLIHQNRCQEEADSFLTTEVLLKFSEMCKLKLSATPKFAFLYSVQTLGMDQASYVLSDVHRCGLDTLLICL